MRILLITDDYLRQDSIGGGDIIAQNLKKGLQLFNYSVAVACNWGKEYYSAPNHAYRIFSPRRVWKNLKFKELWWVILKERLRIKFLIKRYKPDLIYCLHQSGIMVPTISYINLLPLPKVYRMGYEWLRLHYYDQNWCKWTKFWENSNNILKKPPGLSKLLNGTYAKGYFVRPEFESKFVICNSIDLKNRISPYLSNKTVFNIIKNGIDHQIFKPNSQRKNRDQTKLLFVGRLVKHKGVHILIDAIRYLYWEKNIKNIELTIVGWSRSKNYIDHLKNMINCNRLGHIVSITGLIPNNNLPRIYQDHDILLFPSIERPPNKTVEGCPTVLLEAMASGLPIVARLSSGVNEILINFKNCLGVFSDDPQEFAHGIIKIMNNKELSDRLIQTGLNYVKKNCTFENMISKTIKVFEEVIKFHNQRFINF